MGCLNNYVAVNIGIRCVLEQKRDLTKKYMDHALMWCFDIELYDFVANFIA